MSFGRPLKNSCKYSFQDLMNVCRVHIDLKDLYALSQEHRNNIVKRMCTMARWHWRDIIGDNGVLYTAFSPELD